MADAENNLGKNNVVRVPLVVRPGDRSQRTVQEEKF
jgi:hypothetical protein